MRRSPHTALAPRAPSARLALTLLILGAGSVLAQEDSVAVVPGPDVGASFPAKMTVDGFVEIGGLRLVQPDPAQPDDVALSFGDLVASAQTGDDKKIVIHCSELIAMERRIMARIEKMEKTILGRLVGQASNPRVSRSASRSGPGGVRQAPRSGEARRRALEAERAMFAEARKAETKQALLEMAMQRKRIQDERSRTQDELASLKAELAKARARLEAERSKLEKGLGEQARREARASRVTGRRAVPSSRARDARQRGEELRGRVQTEQAERGREESARKRDEAKRKRDQAQRKRDQAKRNRDAARRKRTEERRAQSAKRAEERKQKAKEERKKAEQRRRGARERGGEEVKEVQGQERRTISILRPAGSKVLRRVRLSPPAKGGGTVTAELVAGDVVIEETEETEEIEEEIEEEIVEQAAKEVITFALDRPASAGRAKGVVARNVVPRRGLATHRRVFAGDVASQSAGGSAVMAKRIAELEQQLAQATALISQLKSDATGHGDDDEEAMGGIRDITITGSNNRIVIAGCCVNGSGASECCGEEEECCGEADCKCAEGKKASVSMPDPQDALGRAPAPKRLSGRESAWLDSVNGALVRVERMQGIVGKDTIRSLHVVPSVPSGVTQWVAGFVP